MFCPSNDTLANITEKTKLLAQKCTQQIRVQQCVINSPVKTAVLQNSNSVNCNNVSAQQQQQQYLSTTTTTTKNNKDFIVSSQDDSFFLSNNSNKPNGKPNFKCFCPCKGPLNIKVLTKKNLGKEANTKWYVKVIQ